MTPTLSDVTATSAHPLKLDPIALLQGASAPVLAVVAMLGAAAFMAWAIAILKLFQIGRMRRAQKAFEREAYTITLAQDLFSLSHRHKNAPGARIVLELSRMSGGEKLMSAIAKRALVYEEQRAGSMLSMLATIASASPFIGLFGTVYGIMEAFLKIGQEKSASLPVVAPAIGEALIATAIGLLAAIPALIAFNALSRRVNDLLAVLEASSERWVAIASEGEMADVSPLPHPELSAYPRDQKGKKASASIH